MRRLTLTIGIVVVLVTWHPLSIKQTVYGQIREQTIAPSTPDAVRDWDNTVGRMLRTNELQVRLEREETLLPGRTIQQLDQYSKGVRIWGAGVSRQLEGQTTLSVFGVLYVEPGIDVAPRLTQADAEAAVERMSGLAPASNRRPELVILPDEGLFRLVWVAEFATLSDALRVFFDANTGAVVRQDSLIETQLPPSSYVGHGRGVLGDDKKISTDAIGGGFRAFDTLRPPEISTYDLRSSQTRAQQLFLGVLSPTLSDYATTTSGNDWSDGAAVDAHVYASWTYDYYFKQLKRQGIDKRDGPIRNLTHTVRRSDISPTSDTKWWINAQYNPLTNMMYYGEGLDFPVDFGDGAGLQRINYFSGALDIVAHELTHGVTFFASNLEYRNESGALNESYSDIVGTSVEFFFQPVGSGLMKADYLIGEDTVTAAAPGALNGSRSMANPRLYGQPDHYSRRLIVPLSNDSGGVHTNSGIPNQAFYLAIEGGTNSTSGIRVQGVGPSNRAQIEKVFYHAFADLMRSTANFSMARALTLQAAQDLYGLNSAPYNAIRDAWTAVGVN